MFGDFQYFYFVTFPLTSSLMIDKVIKLNSERYTTVTQHVMAPQFAWDGVVNGRTMPPDQWRIQRRCGRGDCPPP